MIFNIVSLVLGVFILLNTLYGLTKSGLEFSCYYSRPGFSLSVDSSSSFEADILDKSESYYTLIQSKYNSKGECELYFLGDARDKDLKSSIYSKGKYSLSNSTTTVEVKLDGIGFTRTDTFDEVISVLRINNGFSLSSNDPRCISVESKDKFGSCDPNGGDNYCRVFIEIETFSRNCDLPKSFQTYWFFCTLIIGTLIFIIILFSQITVIGNSKAFNKNLHFLYYISLKIRLFCRRICEALGKDPDVLFYFCNESDKSTFVINEGRSFLSFCSLCDSFNPPKFEIDSFSAFFKGINYTIHRKGLFIQDSSRGSTNLSFPLSDFQYNLLCWYLSVVNDKLNPIKIYEKIGPFGHSPTFEEVFKKIVLEGRGLKFQKNEKKKTVYFPVDHNSLNRGREFSFDPKWEDFDEVFIKEMELNIKVISKGFNSFKGGEQKIFEFLRLLYIHNKLFFRGEKTGCFRGLMNCLNYKFSHLDCPDGVKNSQWKMYISDFCNILSLFPNEIISKKTFGSKRKPTKAFEKTKEFYEKGLIRKSSLEKGKEIFLFEFDPSSLPNNRRIEGEEVGCENKEIQEKDFFNCLEKCIMSSFEICLVNKKEEFNEKLVPIIQSLEEEEEKMNHLEGLNSKGVSKIKSKITYLKKKLNEGSAKSFINNPEKEDIKRNLEIISKVAETVCVQKNIKVLEINYPICDRFLRNVYGLNYDEGKSIYDFKNENISYEDKSYIFDTIFLGNEDNFEVVRNESLDSPVNPEVPCKLEAKTFALDLSDKEFFNGVSKLVLGGKEVRLKLTNNKSRKGSNRKKPAKNKNKNKLYKNNNLNNSTLFPKELIDLSIKKAHQSVIGAKNFGLKNNFLKRITKIVSKKFSINKKEGVEDENKMNKIEIRRKGFKKKVFREKEKNMLKLFSESKKYSLKDEEGLSFFELIKRMEASYFERYKKERGIGKRFKVKLEDKFTENEGYQTPKNFLKRYESLISG